MGNIGDDIAAMVGEISSLLLINKSYSIPIYSRLYSLTIDYHRVPLLILKWKQVPASNSSLLLFSTNFVTTHTNPIRAIISCHFEEIRYICF